ncbi:MAG: 30S ribosomal protein S8 [Candidatus Moranbacteria bacterium]|nr:30S ribosomal protein S8 [Candidatus Moranbacteria bacterium]
MLDPISDMLTRIRNAQRAGKEEVLISFSNLKMAIAKILEDKGYVERAVKEMKETKANIRIYLKYLKDSNVKKAPAIRGIRRISKEGKRVYTGNRNIKPTRYGHGITVISTSRGVMTGKEARQQKVGGELICEVW